MTSISNARHACETCSQAREKAADWHVRVDQIGLFRAQQGDKLTKGGEVRAWRNPSREWQTDNPKALSTNLGQQRTLGADSHHFVAACADAAHQGQEKVAE